MLFFIANTHQKGVKTIGKSKKNLSYMWQGIYTLQLLRKMTKWLFITVQFAALANAHIFILDRVLEARGQKAVHDSDQKTDCRYQQNRLILQKKPKARKPK